MKRGFPIFIMLGIVAWAVVIIRDDDSPQQPLPLPFESDARIPWNRTDANLAPFGWNLIKLIRAYDWRCDTISGIVPMTRRRGYFVKCNGYMYAYEIVDRGGTWTVTLD